MTFTRTFQLQSISSRQDAHKFKITCYLFCFSIVLSSGYIEEARKNILFIAMKIEFDGIITFTNDTCPCFQPLAPCMSILIKQPLDRTYSILCACVLIRFASFDVRNRSQLSSVWSDDTRWYPCLIVCLLCMVWLMNRLLSPTERFAQIGRYAQLLTQFRFSGFRYLHANFKIHKKIKNNKETVSRWLCYLNSWMPTSWIR